MRIRRRLVAAAENDSLGGLLRYWPAKLRGATAAAFELDEVRPEQD
jgi:hypothetical protein